MASDRSHGPHNEEIEALRAIAVLFVLGHHYHGLLVGVWFPFSVGLWVGVDVFLCISGYVIARSLLPALEGKVGREYWREVGAFWIKRWYRITPAAWLWIVAVMALNGVQSLKHNSVFWYDAFAAIFQYANFHHYKCTVDAAKHCSSYHLYWSLSLEEQFYLLFPLAAFLFRKRFAWFLLAVAISQMVIERHHWTGVTGFFRTDAIALGVLLAIFSRQPDYRTVEPKSLARPLGQIVPLLLVMSIGVIAFLRPFPLYLGVLSIFCMACVWLASYDKGYFMRPGILRSIAVKIGERSFSIYLGQIVCFILARWIVAWIAPGDTTEMTARPLLTVFVGTVTMAVLVEASYRLVEVPWRRRGRLVAERFKARGEAQDAQASGDGRMSSSA